MKPQIGNYPNGAVLLYCKKSVKYPKTGSWSKRNSKEIQSSVKSSGGTFNGIKREK